MLRFLRQNLGWMLFSLAVSLSLWVGVNRQQNPDVTNVVSNIPVEVVGVPSSLTVRNPPQSVSIRATAPRERWSNLGPESFKMFVDASLASDGINELKVQGRALSGSVRLEEALPPLVLVGFARLKSKDVPVIVNMLDTAPFGYRADPPTVSPERVTVSGPESQVLLVVGVAVDARLDGSRTRLSRWYQPTPIGIDKDEIRDVVIKPESVLVEVPVEQELMYKTVVVVPEFTGRVVLGYQMVGYNVEPSSVTLVGSPAVLAELNHVATKPVDLTGASRDVIAYIELLLPSRAALARTQDMVVRVYVNAVQASTTISVALEPVNLRDGLQATLLPSEVEVTISGPMPLLSALAARDLQPTLDLRGLGPGTHAVEPSFTTAPSLKRERTLPERVTVVIRAKPEPTPTTSPSPEPGARATVTATVSR